MFSRTIITTEDGSQSIFVNDMNEHYHSIHGAVQESMHVFICQGLRQCCKDSISILEIGFGTALNALLTYVEAQKTGKQIHYHSLEKYPLIQEEYALLDYSSVLKGGELEILQTMHRSEWEHDFAVSNFFTLLKTQTDMCVWLPNRTYDVVYFDAFAPEKQPDLWTESIFRKLFDSMNDGGILATYCAKGQVRRNMTAAGFTVARLPGPPGKREMLVARKFL